MISRLALVDVLAQTIVNLSGQETVVKLFKNNIVPTVDTALADFEEADFSGYMNQPVGFTGAVWDDDNGNAVLSFTSAHFQGDVGGVSNLIYGYYVVTDAPELDGHYLDVGLFDPPIPMDGVLDAIDVVVHIKIGQPT